MSPSLRRIFREVDLTDAGGKPVGSFDGVDMAQKLFIENKAARGTAKMNPATGKPYNPNAIRDFVQKQVVDKTSAKSKRPNPRIKVLIDGTATATRPGKGGSAQVPDLVEIQGFRKVRFRFDGDSPELRAEVAKGLTTLRAENPGWTFEAEFGANILLPPLPSLRGDEDQRTAP